MQISFDTSEGSSSSSSSSSSSEESPNLQKDIQKLSPDQQKELTRQFLNHLLAISHMQADERKIEHEILEDLTKIPNFENDALAAIKKFRRALDEGRKTLDKIVEQRKGKLVSTIKMGGEGRRENPVQKMMKNCKNNANQAMLRKNGQKITLIINFSSLRFLLSSSFLRQQF